MSSSFETELVDLVNKHIHDGEADVCKMTTILARVMLKVNLSYFGPGDATLVVPHALEHFSEECKIFTGEMLQSERDQPSPARVN